MKEFECKRCGFLLYLSPKDKKEPLCSLCRGAMGETNESKSSNALKLFKCPKCNGTFYLKKTENPYKCPFCNYTFVLTPRLKQRERL